MADTLVSDAVAFPQDEGLDGISNDQERWSSAGYLAALAQFIGSGGYVHSGLTFSGHDAANDQVDLDAGRCFVVAATGTMGVDVQSTLGGLSSPAYDTTLQAAIPLLIELPTTVTNLAVQDSTTSAVWVAYDNDGTGPGSAGTVYVRTDDTGSVTAPSHPSVKIGEANPDDSTADTRANDNPTETFQKVTTDQATINQVAVEAHQTLGGGDQTIPNSSNTKVRWDTNDFVDSDVFTFDDANDEIDVDVAGKYEITARLAYRGSADWTNGDRVILKITINGTLEAEKRIQHNGVNEIQGLSVETTENLSVNDTISVETFQDTGGNESTVGDGNNTAVEVKRVG